MPKDTHKKIALVTISLAGGGAERSTALLSRMLEARGFKVTIITLNDNISYTYAGSLYNMGIKKKEKDLFFSRLLRFKKLRRFLKKSKFDVIIDNRNRNNASKEQFYLRYIYRDEQVVYVARSFKLDNYFPKGAIAQKMIDQSAGIVGVSKAISEAINIRFSTSKATTIYNPVEPIQVVTEQLATPYFIFTGRLVDAVKNVSLLLSAFAKAKKENFHLHIYGDGPDKEKLQKLATQLALDDVVHFFPFQSKIASKVATAKALLLTSHYEGFPRAIIEALSVGTPVISVDCESGPKEVIISEYNGLLVPNYDEEALTRAMERFITDGVLYESCKKHAVESVAHLSLEAIGEAWEHYIHTL